MVSFAAQKFLSDLAKESYALSKKRQQVAPSGSQQQQKASRRNVMLLEDVASAAAKYGIRVSKPEVCIMFVVLCRENIFFFQSCLF